MDFAYSFLSSAVQLRWSIKVWCSAPQRQGDSAMPVCSMEQKRCISVTSWVLTWGGRKRVEMEMKSEGLKIFTLKLPLLAINFLSSGCSHLKNFTCPHAALSVSQRSTLRRMISYGPMVVPADWLLARTGPSEHHE